MLTFQMNYLLVFLRKFLSTGQKRTAKAKKHILISFIFKGLSILSSFILVPVTLNYLGEGDSDLGNLKYGIWLTISSVIGWFGFFDIGIGNGLRNKFAEAIANDQKEQAKAYVSSAYAIFILLFGSLMILLLILHPFIHWSNIFNAPNALANEVNLLIIFVIFFFFIRFIFGLIGIILIADQRPAINNSINPLSTVISLLLVFILTKVSSGSLLYLGIILSFVPVIIVVFYSIYFFNRDYKEFRPSIKYVNFKYFYDLGSIGLQFFVLQMAVLIIFFTDNLIITRVLSPEEVTPYNIAFKYFSIITMIFNIIMTPFWSAYTEAYVKEDLKWIKKSQKYLILIWGVASFITIILMLISNWFYKIWVGEMVSVPIILSVFMGFFVIIRTFNDIFAHFLNGTGKIRVQLVASLIMAVLNIPLSILFAKNFGLGSTGVIIATCVCLFPGMILGPIQSSKIISKKDTGLWCK